MSGRRGRLGLVWAGLAALLLGGCATVSELPEPESIEAPPELKAEAGAAELEEGWWMNFEDARLEELVRRAEESSPTLEQAVLRVEQAVALAGLEGSALAPQLEFLVSATRSRQSGTAGNVVSPGTTRNRFFAALELDWEIDPWGRLRRERRAAELEAEAAGQAYGFALTLLRSQVAQTYFLLRGVERRIGILEATITVREEALKLVQIRQESGLSDELELAQARTVAASARADLERARAERVELENALARLTGQMPSGFRLTSDSVYQANLPPAPRAVASELLQRRPDIREALQLIRAASERIGARVAEFYPSLELTGNFGYASSETDSWLEDASRLWSLGPSLNLPLFQGRDRELRLELAEIEYRRLFSAYHEQVLRAFEEVETSLATLHALEREAEALGEANEAAARAASLARQRYESGLVSYLEVVDTERAALAAALRYSQIQIEQLTRYAQLAVELGGGWEATER